MNQKYIFFKLTTPAGTIPEEVLNITFKRLIGKIYCPFNGINPLVLALDRSCDNTEILEYVDSFYAKYPYILGEDIEQIGNAETKISVKPFIYSDDDSSIPMVADDYNPSQYYNNIMLVGCYKDIKHLEWITTNKLYNIRIGERNGGIDKSGTIVAASRLLLYNSKNPEEYQVYRLDSTKQLLVCSSVMEEKKYPGIKPGREYILYVVGEKVSKTYSVQDLKKENAPQLKKNAPFFVKY